MLELQNFRFPPLSLRGRGQAFEQKVGGIIIDPLVERQAENMWHLRRTLRRNYIHTGPKELQWFMDKPDEACALIGKPRPYERVVFFDSLTADGQIENLRWDAENGNGFQKASPLRKDFGWNSMLGLAALYVKGGRGD